MRRFAVCLAGLSLLAASAAILAGCGSDWQNYEEKFLRSGICRPDNEEVPEWVQGRVPVDENDVYFVGRGMGHNVFDERDAYDAAVDHVVEQVAKQVATWVSVQTEGSDVRTFAPGSGLSTLPGRGWGNRFQPGERSKQELQTAVKMCTEALVGELKPRDIYWEQWYLDEMPERPQPDALRMKRYKCWVLMSIPKDAMMQRIVTTLEAVKVAGHGPNTLYASVAEHSGKSAKPLDVAGASKLFVVTSPHSERLVRTKKSDPPRWDKTLDIPEEEE